MWIENGPVGQIPVVTLDGPAGSGKGTISRLLAEKLGWHLLDSGLIYRAVAWVVIEQQLKLEDLPALISVASKLTVEHTLSGAQEQVIVNGHEVTSLIRQGQYGQLASQLAVVPALREALLDYQRSQWRLPGLVADGRDMGSVVFPEAPLKIFLTADLAIRAGRRFAQLRAAGHATDFSTVLAGLRKRDQRDQWREVAPLKATTDAVVIDTTILDIATTLAKVMALVETRQLGFSEH